jgi:preprotein translocase subunit SecD
MRRAAAIVLISLLGSSGALAQADRVTIVVQSRQGVDDRIGGEMIASAREVLDAGEQFIEVKLVQKILRQFGAATQNAVGGRMSFILDGQAVLSVVIAEPVCGGVFRFSLDRQSPEQRTASRSVVDALGKKP